MLDPDETTLQRRIVNDQDGLAAGNRGWTTLMSALRPAGWMTNEADPVIDTSLLTAADGGGQGEDPELTDPGGSGGGDLA